MMRNMRVGGSFFLSLLINMFLHFEGSVPTWILLVLHFVIGLSIQWFWSALGVWFGGLMLWMLIVGRFCSWASRCGSTADRPKENKNPYSVGAKKQDGTETK